MAREPKYPVQTVTKALEIINYLAKDTGNQGVGISEFSRDLDMGKSTVHRLLDTLQFYGYIEKNDETNRYRLGWELYKIGQVVPVQNQLLNLNPSYLMELGRTVQEVVNLAILKRSETILISKIESSTGTLRVNVNPGEYESIYATALGKVLISEMSEEQIRTLLEGEERFPAYTKNTIPDLPALLEEEELVRRQGYAVDAEEFSIGLYCIAMPVRDYRGEITAAVSVSTPTPRMDAAKKQLILDALKKCSQEISRSLGYRA